MLLRSTQRWLPEPGPGMGAPCTCAGFSSPTKGTLLPVPLRPGHAGLQRYPVGDEAGLTWCPRPSSWALKLSEQLVSRATQFPSLSFLPRAAGLDDLGAPGSPPLRQGQGSAYRRSLRDLGFPPFPRAGTHSAIATPPLWASVSLSGTPEAVSLTPGPSPAVPSCTCELLRAEAGRRDGPSFSTASPCPPGSPQSLPLPRLPGTSPQLQAW